MKRSYIFVSACHHSSRKRMGKGNRYAYAMLKTSVLLRYYNVKESLGKYCPKGFGLERMFQPAPRCCFITPPICGHKNADLQ
jgi:hypothetical protein